MKAKKTEIDSIKQKFNNKKIVFFVCRHVSYKGIDLLIKAEKFIKQDCVILIAGTGELNSQLKDMTGNNSRIKFIGRLSNNEMKYFLHAADVFAFPSHNRSEAFGVALAEALYCGLPAVSFNIEGSGALWVNKHNYTGLVVENRNVEQFGAAIDEILGSENLRNEFSINAKKWINENFLNDQIAPIMQKIYE